MRGRHAKKDAARASRGELSWDNVVTNTCDRALNSDDDSRSITGRSPLPKEKSRFSSASFMTQSAYLKAATYLSDSRDTGGRKLMSGCAVNCDSKNGSEYEDDVDWSVYVAWEVEL
jgi:hypothetical protein